MNLTDLFEARFRRTPLLDKLEAHRDDPRIFVTFTDINKIGINPSSPHEPLGIYAYPVREMFEDFSSKIVPFAGSRRLCYILQEAGNTLELQQYTYEQLVRDIDLIQHKYWPMLMAQPDNIYKRFADLPDIADPQAHWEGNLMSWYDRWGDNPGIAFWKMTNRIASYIEARTLDRDSAVIWNSIMRSCGYDGICDRGDKIIHTNEAAQAVFLHKQAVTILEAVPNDLLHPPVMTPYGDAVTRKKPAAKKLTIIPKFDWLP